jgi:hypothetical protein
MSQKKQSVKKFCACKMAQIRFRIAFERNLPNNMGYKYHLKRPERFFSFIFQKSMPKSGKHSAVDIIQRIGYNTGLKDKNERG